MSLATANFQEVERLLYTAQNILSKCQSLVGSAIEIDADPRYTISDPNDGSNGGTLWSTVQANIVTEINNIGTLITTVTASYTPANLF